MFINIRKYVIIVVTIMIIFNLVIPNVEAGSITDQLVNSRGKAIKMAKIGLALYLFSKIDNLVEGEDMSEEQNNIDNEDTSRNEQFEDSNNYSNDSRRVIVLDPGHGGYDPGAVGPAGTHEADINLDIAQKLSQILKQNTDWRVYLTRKDDRFISLSQRTAMARRLNADMFISIHSNADKAGVRRGIETYAHYNSGEKGWSLAWYIQDSLVNSLRLENRGIKSNNFQVIRETPNMKSVLLEIGYLSHLEEERLLRKSEFRQKAARAIFNGIKKYYSIN